MTGVQTCALPIYRMDDAIIYEPPYKAIILCIVVVIMLIYAIMKLSMTKLRRISLGLEDKEDLIADISNALDCCPEA